MVEIKQIESGYKRSTLRLLMVKKEAGRDGVILLPVKPGMILDHTEVSDEYRGQNIGKRILMRSS